MTLRTLSAVASVMPGSPLSTRDTVWRETPARAATSRIDAGRVLSASTP